MTVVDGALSSTKTMRRLLLTLLSIPLGGCATIGPSGEVRTPPEVVLFVCPYGGAKSLIAASYFNRAARNAGLPLLVWCVANSPAFVGLMGGRMRGGATQAMRDIVEERQRSKRPSSDPKGAGLFATHHTRENDRVAQERIDSFMKRVLSP